MTKHYIEFRPSETKKGVWIKAQKMVKNNDPSESSESSDLDSNNKNFDTRLQTVFSKSSIWNSYNRTTDEWLIKKDDLPTFLKVLKEFNIDYEKLPTELQNVCNDGDVNNHNSNYSDSVVGGVDGIGFICNPETGKWVSASSNESEWILRKYPETVKKLPPVKIPTKQDMINYFDIAELDTVCTYFLKNNVDKEDAMKKRKDLIQQWIVSTNLSTDLSNITQDKLLYLFELIDREIFNGKIQNYLIKTGRHVQIYMVQNSDLSNVVGRCDSNLPKGDDDDNCVFTISVGMTEFLNSMNECKYFRGFIACNPAEYLELHFERLISELVGMIFCKESDSSMLANRIAHSMFAHRRYVKMGGDDESKAYVVKGGGGIKNNDDEPPNGVGVDIDLGNDSGVVQNPTQSDVAENTTPKTTHLRRRPTNHIVVYQWNTRNAQAGIIDAKKRVVELVSNLRGKMNITSRQRRSYNKNNSRSVVGQSEHEFVRFKNKELAIQFAKIISRSKLICNVKYMRWNPKTGRMGKTIVLKTK